MEVEIESIQDCELSVINNHVDRSEIETMSIEITSKTIERMIQLIDADFVVEEAEASVTAKRDDKKNETKIHNELNEITTELIDRYSDKRYPNNGNLTSLIESGKMKIQQEVTSPIKEDESKCEKEANTVALLSGDKCSDEQENGFKVNNEWKSEMTELNNLDDEAICMKKENTAVALLSDDKCSDEQENDFKVNNEWKSEMTELNNLDDEAICMKKENTAVLSDDKCSDEQENRFKVNNEWKSQRSELINIDEESKYETEGNVAIFLPSDVKTSQNQKDNINKVQLESKSQTTELSNSDDESDEGEPPRSSEATRDEIQCPVDLLEESNNKKFKWPDVLRTALPILQNVDDSLKWVIENKKVLIRSISWNLCARPPPSIESLRKSPMFSSNIFHLYIIGTEECERSIAQSAINTSKKLWESYLINLLGPSYIPLRSHTLQAIHLIIFAHQSIAHLITDINSTAIATGVNNTLGNKGGVSIHMKILNTSFLFTNAHLAAGQKSVSRRNDSFDLIDTMTPKKLFRKSRRKNSLISPDRLNNFRSESKNDTQLTSSPDNNNMMRRNRSMSSSKNQNVLSDEFYDSTSEVAPCTLDEFADRVIFMGDLNYRISGERKMILTLLERKMHEVLLNNDQLRKCMQQNLVFRNFKEPPLNFFPTYKYDIESDKYDTGHKNRSPAWTDRILYVDRGLDCLEYCSDDAVRSSDHRPVYATFLACIDDFDNSTMDINNTSDTDRSLVFVKTAESEIPSFTQESQVCIIS